MKKSTDTLILLALVTVIFLTIYYGVQQGLRQSVYDPQIQIAEDDANMIASGTSPIVLVPAATVDAQKSLAPFVVVYDDSGKVLASSGMLNGQAPTPPKGVFDFARQNGEDRISWQPQNGVRLATVVTKINGQKGFVLAARSMREVEGRIQKIFWGIVVGWLISLGLVCFYQIRKR